MHEIAGEHGKQAMAGRICLITGANRGIGRATALGLAKLGATVVLVCRDSKRGEAAQVAIRAESGNANVDLLASAPEVAALSGQHFIDKKAVRSSKATYDAALAQRLWAASAALTRTDLMQQQFLFGLARNEKHLEV